MGLVGRGRKKATFPYSFKIVTFFSAHPAYTYIPRPTGTPDFHWGGGSNTPPPSISAPIRRREKRKKTFKTSSKMITKLFSQFFAMVKIVAPRAKKWQNFRVFRDCQTSFRKTSITSGTIMARANPKTAFERELNSPSPTIGQIWPKVNALASRGQRS